MLFATERMPLATFLLASRSLQFIRCEAVRYGRVRFIFDDPDNKAPGYELEFESGKPIPVTNVFASQKYLRRIMSRILDKQHTLKYGF